MRAFYLIIKDNGELSLSPFPEADRPAERAFALKPALPLFILRQAIAQRHWQQRGAGIQRAEAEAEAQSSDDLRGREGKEGQAELENQVRKALKRIPSLAAVALSWEKIEERFYSRKEEAGWELAQRMKGRQLTGGDLARLAKEMNAGEEGVWRTADNLVRQGLGEWLPALERTGPGWRCERCGETDIEEWPGHYGESATCPSCSSLGAATSQEVLYRDFRSLNGQALNPNYCFQPHWLLTAAQERAAQEIIEYVQCAPKREAFVWAACGAGKTEVCFPALDWALRRETSILFAAPRLDVVHDVAPRLRRNFKNLEIQILSGEVPRKFTPGPLVLATTHQVLRFYQAFGLIILDEMDAFPYAGSAILNYGLKQALAPGGRILYMTATPSREYLRKAEQGHCQLIRLPARHHRKPVPVPEWIKLNLAQNMSACPEALSRQLRRLALVQTGPVLIFVPKISWVKPWVDLLKRSLPFLDSSGSYSSDPERAQKIAALRQGKYQLFVATTILERGVTIAGAQVVVLAADHPVFDERALVQMSGRAGRSAGSPGGRVLFLAARQSDAMKTARKWLEDQNALAASLGLIDL